MRTSRASTSTPSTGCGQPRAIIDEVDVEFELIRRDNIKVAYILALLASIAAVHGGDADAAEDAGAKKKAILDVLGAEQRLRSKREFIEEFNNAHLPTLRTEDETWAAFRKLWGGKRTEAFDAICIEEGLTPEAFSELMAAYQFTCAEPLADELISTINEPPGILQRKKVATCVVERMIGYIKTFDEHIGNIDAGGSSTQVIQGRRKKFPDPGFPGFTNYPCTLVVGR